MNVLKQPFGGGDIIHFGSEEEAKETQRVINARADFAKKYAEENGWNLNEISIEQLMEIRDQKEWKKP